MDNNDQPSFEELAGRLGIRYVHENRTGISFARTAGIAIAGGDLVAFVDDDCTVEGNWGKRMMEAFSRSPGIAAVGGRDITPQDSSFFEKAIGLLWEIRGRPLSRLGVAVRLDTCNICYRKEALIKGGGFDTKLKRSVDLDFHLRLHELGYELAFDPSIVVYHRRRASLKAYWTQYYSYGQSNFLVLRKHGRLFFGTANMIPPAIGGASVAATIMASLGLVAPLLLLVVLVFGYGGLISIKIMLLGRSNWKYVPLAFLALVFRHFAQATGFYAGLFQSVWGRIRNG